jgi:hypothetical protein
MTGKLPDAIETVISDIVSSARADGECIDFGSSPETGHHVARLRALVAQLAADAERLVDLERIVTKAEYGVELSYIVDDERPDVLFVLGLGERVAPLGEGMTFRAAIDAARATP